MYKPSPTTGALRQGEIVSGITRARLTLESLTPGSQTSVTPDVYQWAIILTQHCDLDWDFKARNGQAPSQKIIPNILFFELNTFSEVDSRLEKGNAAIWKRVNQHQEERYHFFPSAPATSDARGEGLPELVADFKRYFTVPTDEVYRRLELQQFQRRCFLISPYMQHLVTRCFHFHLRVALPDEAPPQAQEPAG